MAKLGNVTKFRMPKCRHRYTWVVSYTEHAAATQAVQYQKYEQCRRCGEFIQRVA